MLTKLRWGPKGPTQRVSLISWFSYYLPVFTVEGLWPWLLMVFFFLLVSLGKTPKTHWKLILISNDMVEDMMIGSGSLRRSTKGIFNQGINRKSSQETNKKRGPYQGFSWNLDGLTNSWAGLTAKIFLIRGQHSGRDRPTPLPTLHLKSKFHLTATNEKSFRT